MRNKHNQPNYLAAVIFTAITLAFAVVSLFHLIPPRPYGLSGDFRLFYSASKLFWEGRNPYNLHALGIVEQHSLHYSYLQSTPTAYVNPPILAAILWPFTRLPYWDAYTAFVVLGIVLAGGATWYLATGLGWRHPGILAGITALSWFELLGLTEGQLDTYLLAILVGAIVFCWREHYLGAGLVMGLFWLKPDILWPAALFMGLVLLPHKRDLVRYLAGLASTSICCVAVGVNFLPTWFHHIVSFGQNVGIQPDLAGLPGLLGPARTSFGLSSGIHSWVTLTVITLAILTFIAIAWLIPKNAKWQRLDRRQQFLWATSLPLGVWLLASPYVHTNDDLLSLPLFLLIVDQDAVLTRGRDALIGMAVVFALFVIWTAKLIPGIYVVLLLLILLGLLWMIQRHVDLPRLAAGACLAAAVTFPTVWSLHLAPVSATSITVLAVVMAAGWRYHGWKTLPPHQYLGSG
jgi:hypothetical protein